MQLEFWNKRWKENQIGFHLPHINPYIEQFWPNFNIEPGANLFIPLCGKSLDIAWFAAQQYSILGIECSQKAVESFFSEQNLSPTIEAKKDFNVYQFENIGLLQGDFFKLNKKLLAEVNAVYDRASLIALPEELRKQYVKLLADNLPPKVSIMLITLEYEQTRMQGPPFSVSNNEVLQAYSADFNIELLLEHDILETQARFKTKGLNYLIERIYKITR